MRFCDAQDEEVKMSCVPILVILGATGAGKSRLAIELARKFCGEIISADSMQVYTGLDIVTAKVTKEERRMAPHHMLDIVEPSTNFTVLQFRDMVLPIMDDLMARKRLPIIVGGTNYYIESLLWKTLIRDPENADQAEQSSEESDCQARDERQEGSSSKKMKFDELTMGKSNEVLHEKLKEVDPEMARRLHPNNRRRIIRSLEVFELHGVTHSEILKAQRKAGGCGLGGPLRHPNSIMLWLRCDLNILQERLDSRVDAMLETGLVQELLDFHRRYNEQRINWPGMSTPAECIAPVHQRLCKLHRPANLQSAAARHVQYAVRNEEPAEAVPGELNRRRSPTERATGVRPDGRIDGCA
ncbi:hypothetical protein KM043_012114 [Ampulex compressa]|nr:hypothetical protein KM043_012114 [Ampulex compressa]